MSSFELFPIQRRKVLMFWKSPPSHSLYIKWLNQQRTKLLSIHSQEDLNEKLEEYVHNCSQTFKSLFHSQWIQIWNCTQTWICICTQTRTTCVPLRLAAGRQEAQGSKCLLIVREEPPRDTNIATIAESMKIALLGGTGETGVEVCKSFGQDDQDNYWYW